MFKSRSLFFLTVFLTIGFFFAAMPENVKAQCEFDISKVEIPDNGVDFDFVMTGDVNDNFGLYNGETANFELSIEQRVELFENVPEGYSLSIQCTQGQEDCGGEEFVPCLSFELLESGNGVRIECLDVDTGSCTFINRVGTISTIPTLSEWSLIAMAAILGLIAAMIIRIRKVAA